MTWWHRSLLGAGAALVIVGGAFAAGWITRGHREVTLAERAAAQLQVTVHTLQSAHQAYVDSTSRVLVAQRAAASHDSADAVQHQRHERMIRDSVAVLITELDDATAAADSLALYPVIVDGLQQALAAADSTASSLQSAYQRQLIASATMIATITRQQTLIDTLARLPRARVDTVIQIRGQPDILRKPETVAIGIVTITACADHPLSIGCAAGAVVTTWRLIARGK